MTNVDNDNAELTDLGLALPYPNQCIPTRFNNGSGAGVNAASWVDMTFVASDPVSELVWSPHKGLSLKCADYSFDERKHSLSWDAERNNVDLPPPQSITSRGSNDDKPIDKGNLITSQAEFHIESGDGERDSLIRSCKSSVGIIPVFGSRRAVGFRAGGNMEELHKSEEGLHINQNEENISNTDGKDLVSPDNIQMAFVAETGGSKAGSESRKTTDFLQLRTHDPGTDVAQTKASSGECNEVIKADPSARIGDVASGSQTRGMEGAMAPEVQNVKHCTTDSPVPDLISQGGRLGELSIGVEEKIKYKTKIDGSTSVPPVEKMESTAENNLHPLFGKDACGQSEERLPRDKSVSLESSPTNSKTRLCRRKGKEKAFPDGDFNERKSKHEDDSHESVESCNSVGLFSAGKKRWGVEQPLIVGSKRLKIQPQESPASTSFVRHDSSFMNWISNMVKGLNKSNQDETPALALTLAHPNHGQTSHDRKIIAYNRNQDPVRKNMGFQTIFQSLYCSNPKEREMRMSNTGYPTEGSKELELANKTCVVNVSPIACHGENDSLSNQFFQSNEKFNEPSYGNEVGPSIKPKNSCAILDTTPGIGETSSSENKIACNVAYSKVKDGRNSSSSSLGERKTQSAENNSSNPDEGKVVKNIGYGSDPRGSLWITRFSPKTPGPLLNIFHCRQNSSGAPERSTDGTRPILQTHNHVDFPTKQSSTEPKDYSTEDPVNAVGKELQSYAPSTEASIGLKKIHGLNDEKSVYKLNPVLPSPKHKSSEAMSSVFARRLDALKQIKPSDAKDGSNRALATCFYCGRSGHDLRECTEIIESERENFMRTTSSCDRIEESHFFCIKCYQHDHWANSCPVVPSTRQHQPEHDASLGNPFSASKLQLAISDERYPRMLKTKESRSQVSGTHTSCDGKSSQADIDLSLNSKWNAVISTDKRNSNSNEVQKLIASTSWDNVLKEKHISSSYNLVKKKFSDVPKGMFDAIRKLRLARMDIIKSMNSSTSLSHLDGFFLRLRLGKREGGLWITGCHVACITGDQREISSQGQKTPISVSIGDMRFFVGSQYISNQDFLEVKSLFGIILHCSLAG